MNPIPRLCIALLVLSIVVPESVTAGSIEVIDLNSNTFPTVQVRLGLHDDSGSAACELPASAFRVTENGVPVDNLGVRWEGQDCGRSLILVMDHSVLTRYQNRLECAKNEAKFLLDELTPEDTVTVIAYGSCSEVVLPRTNDFAAAREAIDALIPIGRAAMTDALYHAVQLACDQGGGSIVWMGYGADTGSAECAFPPDGVDAEALADDAALIRDLAASCDVTLNAVMSGTINRSWIESLTESLRGSTAKCGEVTVANRQTWLGSAGPACCQATLSFTSPDSTLDGSSRDLQVCVDDINACADASYTADCTSYLAPTTATRALLEGSACIAPGIARVVEIEGRVCDSFVGALLHVRADAGAVVDVPLVQEQHRFWAEVPASLAASGARLELNFVGELDGSTWRDPPVGYYELDVCSEPPNDSLRVSLTSATIAAGAQGTLDLMITGDALPYVASYEIDLMVPITGVSIIGVSQLGSVTEAAGWLSPAWNQVGPGLYRVSAAGARRIHSFGVLATLRFGATDSVAVQCEPLRIVRVQLNDGAPVPLTRDGELCVTGGCLSGRVVGWAEPQHGLDGVSVLRLSDDARLTRTSIDGDFELCDLVSPGDELRFESTTDPRPWITPLDASDVLRAVVQLDDLRSVRLGEGCTSTSGPVYPREVAADVSGDGTVGAYDASLILQYVVQAIPEFPVQNWSFVCPTIAVEQSSDLGIIHGIAAGDVNGGSGASGPLYRSSQSSPGLELRHAPGEDDLYTLIVAADGVRAGQFSLRVSGPVPRIEAAAGVAFAQRGGDGVLRVAFATTGGARTSRLLTFRTTDAEDMVVVDGSVFVNDRPSQIRRSDSSVPVRAGAGISLRVKSNAGAIQFSWEVGANTQASIAVFDARGRRVNQFRLESPAGSTKWSARDAQGIPLARGVYFAALRTDSGIQSVRKFIVSSNP